MQVKSYLYIHTFWFLCFLFDLINLHACITPFMLLCAHVPSIWKTTCKAAGYCQAETFLNHYPFKSTQLFWEHIANASIFYCELQGVLFQYIMNKGEIRDHNKVIIHRKDAALSETSLYTKSFSRLNNGCSPLCSKCFISLSATPVVAKQVIT